MIATISNTTRKQNASKFLTSRQGRISSEDLKLCQCKISDQNLRKRESPFYS